MWLITRSTAFLVSEGHLEAILWTRAILLSCIMNGTLYRRPCRGARDRVQVTANLSGKGCSMQVTVTCYSYSEA